MSEGTTKFRLTLSITFDHPSRDTKELNERIKKSIPEKEQRKLKSLMQDYLEGFDVYFYKYKFRTEVIK